MPGFIYMARLLEYPSCYKIGSTADFIVRERGICKDHGACDIFMVGESDDPKSAEVKIQNALRDFSNIRLYGKESDGSRVGRFPGSKNSKEFFTFDPCQMFNAMHILSLHCQSVSVFPDAGWGEGA